MFPLPNFKIIETDKAPKAIGPYSQALETALQGSRITLSGQIGINPETGKLIDEDIQKQTEQIFNNIEAVLNAADVTLRNVQHVRIYLTDMKDYKSVNEIYAKRFGDHKPTREAVQVAGLPLDAKIEMVVEALGRTIV